MGKIKAIIAIGIIAFVVALIAYNTAKPAAIERRVWQQAMTKGDVEKAKHHYVMYSDIFCPYCDKFSNALHANAEDFEKFRKENNIAYEMRMTDFNYQAGSSKNSRAGGESIYCAARQDKFWPYYEEILAKLFNDYHSKGIGVSRISEKIPILDNEYYYEAGEKAGLDINQFRDCMEKHESLKELTASTSKAQREIPGGVPYFVFGDYVANGFDGNWDTEKDYKTAKRMLQAGLDVKK